LGEVLHYEANFNRYKPLVGDRWQETEQPGVGIHYDLGAHIIDQALVLFGMPDWLQGDVQKQRKGSSIIDSFQVRMGRGPVRIELSAGLLVADHDLRYRVHGTRGSWIKNHLDPQEEQIWHLGMTPLDESYGLEDESHFGTLTLVGNGQSTVSRTPTLKGDWPAYYRELSAAIRQGSAPPVTAHQARNTISVIEAMVESSHIWKTSYTPMIRHCVFIQFKDSVTAKHRDVMFSEIAALQSRLVGILDVHLGRNVSPEAGMDKGYADGFMVDFTGPEARDGYLVDEGHKSTGAKLVESAVGGVEGILVYDLEIGVTG
jgi:hypothetical protein